MNRSSPIADDPFKERLSTAEKLCPSSTPRSYIFYIRVFPWNGGDRRGCGRMVVGFITTYAISVCHHWSCDFESNSGEVYSMQHDAGQWLAAGRWFSPPTPFSSTNKTDHHDITEIDPFISLIFSLPRIVLICKICTSRYRHKICPSSEKCQHGVRAKIICAWFCFHFYHGRTVSIWQNSQLKYQISLHNSTYKQYTIYHFQWSTCRKYISQIGQLVHNILLI